MSEFDLEYELELERELESEELHQMPPEDIEPVEVEPASPPQAAEATMLSLMSIDPVESLLRKMREWDNVEVQNQQNPDFMPPIGSMAVDGRTCFEPKPRTRQSAGNVLACDAGMGRGKSTMIREYQRSTITGQARALALVGGLHSPPKKLALLPTHDEAWS